MTGNQHTAGLRPERRGVWCTSKTVWEGFAPRSASAARVNLRSGGEVSILDGVTATDKIKQKYLSKRRHFFGVLEEVWCAVGLAMTVGELGTLTWEFWLNGLGRVDRVKNRPSADRMLRKMHAVGSIGGNYTCKSLINRRPVRVVVRRNGENNR